MTNHILRTALTMFLGVSVNNCLQQPAMATASLVVSDYFGPMRIVNSNSGEILGEIAGGYGAGELDFGPDGLIYASYFESSLVRVLDPANGALRDIGLPGKPRDVIFGPDEQLYIALAGNGFGDGIIGVYRYNLTTQVLAGPVNKFTMNGTPIGLEFGPDDDIFVSLDARYAGNGNHSVVRIDGMTGDDEGVFTSESVHIPQSLAFAPNGDLFVGNQGTSLITQYDGNTGDFLGLLTSQGGNPQGLYFLPDGDLMFGRGGPDFVRYDFANASLSTFSTGYSFAFGSVLVPEPSSKTLLVSSIVAVPVLTVVRRKSKTVRPTT